MAARIVWGRLADAGGGRRRAPTLRDVGLLACAAGLADWAVWPEGTAVQLAALVVLRFGALGFNGVLYLIAGEIVGRRARGPGGRARVDRALRRRRARPRSRSAPSPTRRAIAASGSGRGGRWRSACSRRSWLAGLPREPAPQLPGPPPMLPAWLRRFGSDRSSSSPSTRSHRWARRRAP